MVQDKQTGNKMMNERIKELAEQATSTLSMNHEGYRGKGYIEQVEYFDKEKFAELIVKECCELLKDSGESWEQFSRNPPQGQAHNASGALFAAYRLKEDAVDMLEEHFGIEAPPVDNVDRILRTVRTRNK